MSLGHLLYAFVYFLIDENCIEHFSSLLIKKDAFVFAYACTLHKGGPVLVACTSVGTRFGCMHARTHFGCIANVVMQVICTSVPTKENENL